VERLTALRPVVAGATLAVDDVVRTEEATKRAGSDGVAGAGLEVDEDGARDVLVRADLVEVDINALELEVVRALVHAVTLDAVLLREHLPELGPDLVPALCPHVRDVRAQAGVVAGLPGQSGGAQSHAC
jgi:hypothetical protein